MDLIEQRVRERAYHIWEDEGRVHGRADAHWLRAESEIAAPKAEILTVQTVAEASLAPSPAKTLKPRASRAKAAVEAAVEAKPAKAAAKPAAKITAKPAAPKATKALAAAGLSAKPKTARASATAASLH